MTNPNLEATTCKRVAPDKGILAVDERLLTIGKRFKSIHGPSTEETLCYVKTHTPDLTGM
jgi:fructose-bisphosphate aldolase class 1